MRLEVATGKKDPLAGVCDLVDADDGVHRACHDHVCLSAQAMIEAICRGVVGTDEGRHIEAACSLADGFDGGCADTASPMVRVDVETLDLYAVMPDDDGHPTDDLTIDRDHAGDAHPALALDDRQIFELIGSDVETLRHVFPSEVSRLHDGVDVCLAELIKIQSRDVAAECECRACVGEFF